MPRGALAAYAWSSRQPVRYQGVVRVFLDIRGERVTEPDRIVRSNAEFLNSPAVMDRVVAFTDGRLTHERLEEQVRVEPPTTPTLSPSALDAMP